MGFFSNFFGLNHKNEQPVFQGGFYVKMDGNQKVLDENYLDWFKKNPFVYTAINERSKAVANCKFWIRDEMGNLIENDLTRKLNKPNQYLSHNEFVLQLMIYKGIWGTGYLYVNRLRPSESLDKIQFLNLPTNQILFNDKFLVNTAHDYLWDLLNRNVDDNFNIYYGALNTQDRKLLDKNNLLPFFDTTIFTNPYYSESRLKNQRYVVSNIQAALESENTFLSSPSGIGMLVPDSKDALGTTMALQDHQKEEVEKQLQEEYGSLTHQKNIRIVNAPIRYESTIVDVSKLKLTESLQRNALILFGAYGLPKELLTAMMTGSTFENQKTAYRNFIQSTAQIEADAIANSLDTLFPSSEGRLIADFSHLPIMQENEKERAIVIQTKVTSYSKLLLDGVITKEEYRSLIENDLKIEQ